MKWLAMIALAKSSQAHADQSTFLTRRSRPCSGRGRAHHRLSGGRPLKWKPRVVVVEEQSSASATAGFPWRLVTALVRAIGRAKR
jgi:hypothetical protein